MSIKDKGQITRTSCTRCGSSMLKWERWPKELEVTIPLTMSDSTEAKESFTSDQDSRQFHRLIIEGGNKIVGNLYIPKADKGISE